MNAQEKDKRRSRKEAFEDKKPRHPKHEKSPKRKISIFDQYENWTEMQVEEDWSRFTGEGPYYEFDEHEEQ